MNIILPYVSEPALDVLTALDLSARKVHLPVVQKYIAPGDDTRYYYILKELWDRGQTFMMVEQDIKVNPDTVEGMYKCDGEWCAAVYDYIDFSGYSGLGCVKFDKALMERYPDLMVRVGAVDSAIHPAKHWCSLDAYMQNRLHSEGIHPCRKHGTVYHKHLHPTHGCVANVDQRIRMRKDGRIDDEMLD